MKPTPCKLALAMSLAGLGASLGGAAHARSDDAAAGHSVLATAIGLPLPAVGERFASLPAPVEGFPLAPEGLVDGLSAVAGQAAPAAERGGRTACASAMRGRHGAVTPPRSLWGARRTAVRAPVARAEAPVQAADAAGTAHCGTAPAPRDPAGHRLVDGVGGRPPKVPPRPAAKPWELAGAPGDDPEEGLFSARNADAAPAEPAASTRVPAPGAEAQMVATARVPTPAERVREELARHLPATDAARAAPSAQTSFAVVDIDLDQAAGAAPATLLLEPGTQATYAVDLPLDIEPSATPRTKASPGFGAAAAAPTASVDLELDLELDFYLRSIATAAGDTGSPSSHGAARVDAARGLDIDLDLPDLGLTGADGGRLPARPAAAEADLAATRVPIAVAHPGERLPDGVAVEAFCPAEDGQVTAAALPRAVAGRLHDDATLRRLEALMSQAVAARSEPGLPSDEVFVALGGAAAPAGAAARRPAAAGVQATEEARPAEPAVPSSPSPAALAEVAPSGLLPAPAGGDPAGGIAGEASGTLAADAPGEPRAVLGEAVAMSESRLGEVRGGFQTSGGLHVSFGIERAVYINDKLVSTPPLLTVVERGRGADAAPVAGPSGLTVVQNGSGNTFVPVLIPSQVAGMVIQNTLDGQKIQAITTINATVNSLEIMKARSFESSMRGAIVDSLRR